MDNNITFGANFIQHTTIKAMTEANKYKPMEVSVVGLTKSKSDRQALLSISKLWKGKTNYTETIISGFNPAKSDNMCYILTTQTSDYKKLEPEKVLGIAKISKLGTNNIYFDYLQTNPNYIAKGKKKPLFKYIGKVLSDFVKETNRNGTIYLNATEQAIKFWLKQGYEIVQTNISNPLMKY